MENIKTVYVNVQKCLALTTWYCFKTEGTLHITIDDIQNFVKVYNDAINKKLIEKEKFEINYGELYKSISSLYKRANYDEQNSIKPNSEGVKNLLLVVRMFTHEEKRLLDKIVQDKLSTYNENGLKRIEEVKQHFYNSDYGAMLKQMEETENNPLTNEGF